VRRRMGQEKEKMFIHGKPGSRGRDLIILTAFVVLFALFGLMFRELYIIDERYEDYIQGIYTFMSDDICISRCLGIGGYNPYNINATMEAGKLERFKNNRANTKGPGSAMYENATVGTTRV